MANWQRSLADAFGAWDRALGGQRPPTRVQKWAARHPARAGLCLAAPFTLFFLMLSRADEPDDPLFAVGGGLTLALVFGVTALSEPLRQRRLMRLGLWDGS